MYIPLSSACCFSTRKHWALEIRSSFRSQPSQRFGWGCCEPTTMGSCCLKLQKNHELFATCSNIISEKRRERASMNDLSQQCFLRNNQINERKTDNAFPILKTSAKSVQTTRVVCTNFSRSLCRLQLKFELQFVERKITFACTDYFQLPVQLIYLR